ncbi:hypothetical protein [Glutamicibacter uratoxydans]|uniref:hypothetical protein n=1 Tax=Glutamicibacter uratoxydans TaxID=43667 RepID=UPI003D6E88BC
MNQSTHPLVNQESVPTTQSVTRDWGQQRFLDNQNWQADRETQWERNPHSWMTPELCPWNESLSERFEREYTEVPTLLDAMATILYPEMTEEFMAAMIQNLMFKKGTADPGFPGLFEMSQYQRATPAQNRASNEQMDLIAQEVINHLSQKCIRFSTLEDSVFPSLVAKMKYQPRT